MRGSRQLNHYQSIHNYGNKLWGLLSKPPLPSWYPQAKEVLLKAIELDSEQDNFNLFFEDQSRTITLYSNSRHKEYREMLEKAVYDLIRDKRAKERRQKKASLSIGDFAQTSPSRTEPDPHVGGYDFADNYLRERL